MGTTEQFSFWIFRMHVAAGLISLQVKWDYKYVQLAQSVEHRVLQSGQN